MLLQPHIDHQPVNHISVAAGSSRSLIAMSSQAVKLQAFSIVRTDMQPRLNNNNE